MIKKRKLRLTIATIAFTASLMAFTPRGSFDPMNVGFWACVLGGIIWAIVVYFFLNKYSVKSTK